MAVYHTNRKLKPLPVPLGSRLAGAEPPHAPSGASGPGGASFVSVQGPVGVSQEVPNAWGGVWGFGGGEEPRRGDEGVRAAVPLRGGVGEDPPRSMDLDTWEQSAMSGGGTAPEEGTTGVAEGEDWAERVEWAQRKVRKIADCGKLFRVIKHKSCGAQVVTPIRCDCAKGCVKCARRRSSGLQERYAEVLRSMQFSMFLTLTMPTVPRGSLLEGSKRIWTEWRKLRQRRAHRWIRKWLTSEEVTLTPQGWHIHLHSLIDAPRVKGKRWKALIQDWCDLVGGHPSAQDWRKADPATIGNELLKYLTQMYELEDDALVELLAAYKGRPVFRTCGNKILRVPKKEDRQPLCCPRCKVPYRREEWDVDLPMTATELAAAKSGPLHADYYDGFEGGVVPWGVG